MINTRYIHTLAHLSPIQLCYQFWYRFRDKVLPVRIEENTNNRKCRPIKLRPFPSQHTHIINQNRFSFLNIEHFYYDVIDWNCSNYGKLWNYHLNYFDFLHQPNMDWTSGLFFIEDYLKSISQMKNGLEPYPISLRTINWIKFLAKYEKFPQHIINSLFSQYLVLKCRLEYHLLGNHLLENGFSLLFGAVFFNDKSLKKLARKILLSELEEQILEDGAHFELSPMYHLILLQRSLDGYNLLTSNEHDLDDVERMLESKIQLMVNWIKTMQLTNGDYPMFNDSTPGQALDVNIILDYAQSLGFSAIEIELGESGYRKFSNKYFEMITDAGEIGPSYQPGHANCDMLSFVLYHKSKPIIVDRGISTYEKNELREEERGTASHNTVMINDTEQSDVWGGFRVGRRARPILIEESNTYLKASHTGYDFISARHQREWKMMDDSIIITDTVSGDVNINTAAFHFHPDVTIKQLETESLKIENLIISFSGSKTLEFKEYPFCEGFNKRKNAQKIVVYFDKILKTHIYHQN